MIVIFIVMAVVGFVAGYWRSKDLNAKESDMLNMFYKPRVAYLEKTLADVEPRRHSNGRFKKKS